MTHQHVGGVLGQMAPRPVHDVRLSVTYQAPDLEVYVNNRRVYARHTRDPQAHVNDMIAAVGEVLGEDIRAWLPSKEDIGQ